MKGITIWSAQNIYTRDSYLLIQHVRVLSEPDAEALESCNYHGVKVTGVERGWAAALVHYVAAH